MLIAFTYVVVYQSCCKGRLGAQVSYIYIENSYKLLEVINISIELYKLFRTLITDMF